jgi:hypothetical protein
MNAEAFSFAVEVLGVVGAADVVFHSIASLSQLVERLGSADKTVRHLLITLKGLASAIANARAWAEAYDSSVFVRKDAQVAPRELLPLLNNCNLELQSLLAKLKTAPPSASWHRKLAASLSFVWNESQVQRTLQFLERYERAISLLIQTRSRYVPFS